MLIYDREGIRVHAARLAYPAEGKSGRREAEVAAVAGLLREAFGPDGAEVGHRESGAPYLKGPLGEKFEISISHCPGLALMALAPKGTRIGIDCESTLRGAQLRRIAPRFIARADLERWSADDERLFQAWTIKEAAFKAAGIAGLTIGDIPLPEALPRKNETSDSEIAIGGGRYAVARLEAPAEGLEIALVRGI